MPENERIFSDVYFDGLNLSEEARQVTNEAATAMRQWINDSVKGLVTKFDEAAKTAVSDLDSATKDITKSMDDFAAKLKAIEDGLNSPAPLTQVDLAKKADELKAAVAAVKKDLEERKAKAQAAGAQTMAVLKTGLRASGIPVP